MKFPKSRQFSSLRLQRRLCFFGSERNVASDRCISRIIWPGQQFQNPPLCCASKKNHPTFETLETRFVGSWKAQFGIFFGTSHRKKPSLPKFDISGQASVGRKVFFLEIPINFPISSGILLTLHIQKLYVCIYIYMWVYVHIRISVYTIYIYIDTVYNICRDYRYYSVFICF